MNTFGKAVIAWILILGLQAPVLNFEVSAQEEVQEEQAEETQTEAPAETNEESGEVSLPAGGESGDEGSEGEGSEEDLSDQEQSGFSSDEPEDRGDQIEENIEEGQTEEIHENGGNEGIEEIGEVSESGESSEQDEEDAVDGEDGEGGEAGSEGIEGESGSAGDQKQGEQDEEGDTVIETGDAASVGEIQNTGNVNAVNGDIPLHEEDGQLPFCSDEEHGLEQDEEEIQQEESAQEIQDEENAAEEQEEAVCIKKEDQGGGEGDSTAENQNSAEIENAAQAEADTGANEASGNSGSSTIDTGDAAAILDIFNLINTNIVNSEGLFVLLSNLKEQLLDIDLREWAPYLEEYNTNCDSSCYTFDDLQALNQNIASVTNDVVVRADTGENEANENAGNAAIETGDAYAGANVVNFANTNIIDSNYLLFIANNFGNFFGDIVFPNASSFFSSLFSAPSEVYDVTTISNSSTAAIANNVGAAAETGGNEANENGNSFIQTGDSSAAANVFNQANMNLVGGSSFVALIRISGDWSGDVFGLPEGISWQQTLDGIMLYSDDMGIGSADAGCENCSKQSRWNESSEFNAANENNAVISNNVQVYALTGDNKASRNNGNASIVTGDAQAVANIVNVANTNVIGKNWLFAMFNILGDFNGNVSFGRPDLWIGQRAEIPNDPALPGDEITYYLTVANNGDALAHDVLVKTIFDDLLFSFEHSKDYADITDNEIVWDLGPLNPGESREVSFTGDIPLDVPSGLHSLTNTSSVSAAESDENMEDNTDVVELEIVSQSGGSNTSGGAAGEVRAVIAGESFGKGDTGPNLIVTKTYHTEGDIYPGSSVDYTIVVTNTGGDSAYDAIVVDLLETEDGEIVNEEIWDLGEIFPDEEITVTYTMIFESDAEAGMYFNNAFVEASNGSSNMATTSLELKNNKELLAHIRKELDFVEAEVRSIQGSVLAIAAEKRKTQSLLSYVPPTETAEQKVEEEIQKKNPFLASVFGLIKGVGSWFSALVAASALLLFFLLGKRKRKTIA